MNEDKIGKEGQMLNFSVASRAMNIEPDKDQIEQYDEYEAKGNPIQYFFMLLTLVFAVLSIYGFKTGHWILGIIGILITLFCAFSAYTFGNATLKKEIAYSDGLIIPAIVINTNPIEIIALANMSTEENQKPIYGCLKMQIKSLPNHKIVLDEKVPCVSLFGMEIKGYRRHFEPRPISWGFKDASLISKVINSISADKQEGEFIDEWTMLQSLKNEMKEAPYKEVIFFDQQLQKVEL